jgi:hypothetical protein
LRKRTLVGCAVVVAVSVLVPVSFAGPAHAATVEVDTSQSRLSAGFNQGWWSASGTPNVDTNDNYLVGVHEGVEFRDFFTFDLRLVPEALTVVAATLRVPVGFSNAGDATETVALFDVSTDAGLLNANNGTNPGIFHDLGTGRSYGRVDVARGLVNTIVSFPLNSAAVTDINASRAGFFSIGGALSSLAGRSEEFLFGGTAGGAVRLTMEAFPLPRDKADCKAGGWRNLTDERGVPFASQRQCVDFVLHRH